MKKPSMEDIVSLAKRRGFIYPGSEIYGGLAGTFDYGPLGVALKNNVKQLWWRMFVTDREDMYGIDAAILMNPKAWEASGHVSGFNDPMVDCLECKTRQRVDQLISNAGLENDFSDFISLVKENVAKALNKAEGDLGDGQSIAEHYGQNISDTRKKELSQLTKDLRAQAATLRTVVGNLEKAKVHQGLLVQSFLNSSVTCPTCKKQGSWGEAKQFNMMFATKAGAADDASATVYLRPETAGGMFVNFKNVIDSFHPKLPFGLAQIGKAFRNEIAPRDFVFRSREFEQMEVEYFVRPEAWEPAFEEWHGIMHAFAKAVGLKKEDIHDLEVAAEDRAHYSKRTIDLEYDYPFGRKELWGIAYRTDFDLSAHEKTSGVTLQYLDEETKEKLTPHVIEPSLGVDRTVLAILISAYDEDELGGETRSVLRLPKEIAPYHAAVSPLLKNKPELVAKAREVFTMLKKAGFAVAYDDNGNIGKRYRRQDEIGTPSCIVIDFDTLGETPDLKDTVTVRDRDTGEQKRIAIADLAAHLS